VPSRVPSPQPRRPPPRRCLPPPIPRPRLPPSDDAKALASIVERRYGKHLTPDQLEAIPRDLDQRIQAGRRLRDVVLRNDEEPDTLFRA
jgi:hypothetical protein